MLVFVRQVYMNFCQCECQYFFPKLNGPCYMELMMMLGKGGKYVEKLELAWS